MAVEISAVPPIFDDAACKAERMCPMSFVLVARTSGLDVNEHDADYCDVGRAYPLSAIVMTPTRFSGLESTFA